jgi:flagella basal body P-ring formation protein FlgA
VVCLETGRPGQEIRVRDETNGKVHRAYVGQDGGVQLLGERHE